MLETVLAGQSYSITIKATDASGSSSQTIVEVTVTPGPNIRPPYFDKLVYDVQVTQSYTPNGSPEQKFNLGERRGTPTHISCVSECEGP